MMPDTPSFTLPSFVSMDSGEFFKQLVENLQNNMPVMGQWTAPTFDEEELRRRVHELKTIHYWLEQNAKLLQMSIQALEVQQLTLSALRKLQPNTCQSSNTTTDKTPQSKAQQTTSNTIADPLPMWNALSEQFQQIAQASFAQFQPVATKKNSKNESTKDAKTTNAKGIPKASRKIPSEKT